MIPFAMRRPVLVGRVDVRRSDKSLRTAPGAVNLGHQIRPQTPIRLGLAELDWTVGARDYAEFAAGRPFGEAAKILVANDPLWVVNGVRVRQPWNFGTRPNIGSISQERTPRRFDQIDVHRINGVLHEWRVSRRVGIVIGGLGGHNEIPVV